MKKLNKVIALSLCLTLFAGAAFGARVDVCANAFREGGWKLDVQFMEEMGSPQLLAHGMGFPVPDATASADVPEVGEWRVWVRSRKWVEGAGAFQVLVNGTPLAKTFGRGSDKWSWEDGGAVTLAKGRTTLALRDLDGFDGRCAGIVLTKGEGAPQGALAVTDRAPAETKGFDFVVVGGGLPGCCAAVAAARAGAKVALVQDRPVVGGNASGEVRVWSAGEIRYPLVAELRGQFMNMRYENAFSDSDRMAKLEREPNLSLFVSHRAFAVEKDGDRIAAVKALDLANNRVVRFAAPLFCDTTGDGWVGYWAGADYRRGREGRDETGETYAPEKGDCQTLGSSLMWASSAGTIDIPFSAPWAEPYACGLSRTDGDWNWEFGLRQDVFTEGEAIRDRVLLAIYGAFSNAKKEPKNAFLRLTTCPYILGKRESRRLMGDHIFCERDVTQKTQFDDAVATGSWSVDLHYTVDNKIPFLTRCEQPHYGRYWIPYRSLYSRNVPNLFMAGRCFSCTHVGLGSPRVMNTLSQLGCAVGEAAAMCLKGGYSPRELYAKGHARELQRRLGGDFPGNPDPAKADWSYVDDETKDAVSFAGDWRIDWNCNGGQAGDRTHSTLDGKATATYRLPVKAAGRYRLMGLVPHLFHCKGDRVVELTVASDGRTQTLAWNQYPQSGWWHELGTLDLAPGATLTVRRAEGCKNRIYADGYAIVPAVTFEEAFKTGTAGSITYAEGEAVPKERMQAEVQKVLDRAVAEGRQGALQFCVYIDGECVVDAWAGTYATNSTRKIDGDSLFPIYSTEKQLLVTAAHRAHERGLLDYEKPVKSYWPEFTGSPEKEALTVRELMGHRAGLPSALPKGTALADRTNWNYKVEWFAKQPAKDPGKVSRYLSGSFGVYLGHVLECVYGKPIKEILDEEAIVPAGIARDFFFASGPEEDGRIVTVYNGSEPWSFEKMNETPFRRAIDPAGWAVSSARGIARFYNRLCGFDGQPPLIRPETLDFALRPNRWEGEPVTPEINDKWIMVWGLGYGLWGDDQNLSSVFGQGGLGGSEGMCDRRRRICIGYTCNVSANYDGFNKITPELFRIVGFQTRYTRKGAAERPAPLGGKTELSQARNWFLGNVYGVRPEAAERAKPTFAPIGPDRVMMNGAAVRKRVRVTTAGPYGTNAFAVTAFVPTAARRPVPAFLLICNRDPKENIDPERVNSTEFWPAEEIVRRGYAAVSFHNEEIAPDDPKRGCRAGVFACFEDPSAPRAANAWGTLSAWAWGASRAMDWLETLPEIDAKHVAVVGHSRGGKTALLAGVTDRRFALSCSNDSGCSGAKLNRMSMPESEHIQRIYDVFPHWFCANYAQWKGRDGGVPHDQDRFVAQIAPRLVAIGSAADDAWAGPRAEEACAESARRAWKDPTDVDYHVRPGGHDLNLVDWTAYMDFADRKGWRGALGRVNLFVGTVGAGNLTPAAAYPFGMMNPGPDTSAPGEGTPCPGYRYSDTNLVGFSQQHLNGTGHPGLGDILVFPYCGETADWGDPRQHVLDHAKETATPGYYALTLPQVRAEMTATPRTGCLRFTRRLGAGPFRLLVDLDACLYHLKDGKFDWHVLSNEVRFAEAKDGLSGTAVKKSWGTRSFGYAVAFDRPWTAREELAGEGDRKLPRYVLSFDLKEGEALTVKTAISLRGGEAGAKANLESTPGWTFDGWRRDAEQAWERTLGLATAEGGPDATLDMFCTSLYRCFVHPNLVSDAGTPDRYTTFSLWDTFRAAHPLYTILTPEAVPAFLDSFLDQFEKNGYLPVWTLADEEINCMIANHSIPVIVDAWKKGLVKDPEPLWRAVRATLRENHPNNPKENWPALDTCGYFPNDVFRREACSRTLEVAYNDWCAAEFAEGLGHAADAAFFRKRSASWKNLFDVSAGLVNSRDSQGAWRRPFDPYSSGWGEGYDFTEGNSWQYSWHVFQDPEGLIAAMGGREAFAAKLTRFFDPAHNRLSTGNVKWFVEADLIGQYWHGNEPCQHVPWFWQLVGESERTDEIVREVFDRFYGLRPDGLFGNDDCGQMSAWYVFAAMGFYPVNPCGGEYFVSAPQVPAAQVKVGGVIERSEIAEGLREQRTFRVLAKGLSKENKYVKSVKLNGHELKDRILRHADILKGGELVFEMRGKAK